MTRRFALSAVLFSLFVAGNAFAQSSMGTVTGTVTDASGAVIPGVAVTLTRISGMSTSSASWRAS